MSGRLRACDGHRRTALAEGWEASSTSTSAAAPTWLPASVPGTLAADLRAAGAWDCAAAPRQFDAETWCYRLRFSALPAARGETLILGLDGLATLAQVSLNDVALVDSANMFHEHRCDVTALLRTENELVIRFAALAPALNGRRGRPRWRTPMVSHQQLRWTRTTLLGRTPGWSPPAAPVGPWRPVWLERQTGVQIGAPRIDAGVSGTVGRVQFSCSLSALAAGTLGAVRLSAERDGRTVETSLQVEGAGVRGELIVPDVQRWWPHTHGESALYTLSLSIELHEGDLRRVLKADLGGIGFRTLRFERDAGRFALYVNEQRVFCRGAAWMPLDCISLQTTQADYAAAIERVRSAGMNMLRLAGPTVYETNAFFDYCDAAGVMVWQDFMFANMDYPTGDAEFTASVRLEATQQLARLQARPSLAVLCGNSEGAQQAAMSGAGRECWAPPLFEAELAALSQEACPGVPYCPSSTHGGAFPFQPSVGVTSYYGVGAYLKPLSDARRSELRFASECLAFANIPEDETLALLSPGTALRCHHPVWKARVPRDLGAGWDFDDVRDHYMEELFRIDAMRLRYADHERYLKLGRVASGEVMAAAFAEWRRAASTCSGALLWFLNDLWPGAGWGVIDSTGLPKAAYYYLKRVLQPLAVFVADEDCNGLVLHVVNETHKFLPVRLELRLFKASKAVGTPVSRDLRLQPATTLQLAATDLFEGFMDLSYAFRFGPPAYDLLHAVVFAQDAASPLAEAFHFPQGLANVAGTEVGLTATAAAADGGVFRLTIENTGFAQSVHVEAPGFIADDQYFHMPPNACRVLAMTPRKNQARVLEGVVQALNSTSPSRIGYAT